MPSANSTHYFPGVHRLRPAVCRSSSVAVQRTNLCTGRRPATASAQEAFIPHAHNGSVVEVEEDRFEALVRDALDGLPTNLRRMMRNVAVTVDNDGGPPGLLGLYRGIPLTARTSHYSWALPDQITIYRMAICAICRTEAEVVEHVRRTVIHEVGHHFGIDDARLHELGW